MGRPDVLWPTILIGVFGMFTANLAVTLAAYARSVFHSGPGGYGMLSAIVAVGSLSGALISARRPHPRIRHLLMFGALLAALDLLAAAAPDESTFCVALFGIGAATLLLLTSANSTVQLASHDAIRGRVIGVYLLVFIGSSALGGPLLGTVDQQFGPRAGLLLAGTVSAFASILIATKLAHNTRPATTQSAFGNRPPHRTQPNQTTRSVIAGNRRAGKYPCSTIHRTSDPVSHTTTGGHDNHLLPKPASTEREFHLGPRRGAGPTSSSPPRAVRRSFSPNGQSPAHSDGVAAGWSPEQPEYRPAASPAVHPLHQPGRP